MFCMKCGKEMPNDSKFCINCGAPVETSEPAPPPKTEEDAPVRAQQPTPQQPTPQQPVQFAAAAPGQNYSMPYGPSASGMAPGYMNLAPDFTPEEIALVNKGWNLCKAATIMPIGYGFLHGFFDLPDITRVLSLVAAILLCIDKSYLSRVAIPMSSWYYVAIFFCPPLYLYNREKLTGHGHALSIVYGALYAIGILVLLTAIAKIS